MSEDILRWQDLVLDLGRRQLLLAGEELRLTPSETQLLAYFLRRPKQLITRDELKNHLWQLPPATVNQILDRHLNGLRAKLRGRGKNIVQTVRGEGYALGLSEIITRT